MATPHLHLRDVLAKYSATLVLGSSSRSRQAILRQANVPFTVSIADINERGVGDRARDDPAALTAAVAKAKADAIVAQPVKARTAPLVFFGLCSGALKAVSLWTIPPSLEPVQLPRVC